MNSLVSSKLGTFLEKKQTAGQRRRTVCADLDVGQRIMQKMRKHQESADLGQLIKSPDIQQLISDEIEGLEKSNVKDYKGRLNPMKRQSSVTNAFP